MVTDGIKVVEINLFESLLIRPYATHDDLLKLIEAIYNMSNFQKKRTEAEEKARQKSENFTLTDIYKEMSYPFNSLMESELLLNQQTLQVNPEML